MAQRKFVQISTVPAKGNSSNTTLVALADDGTLWHARVKLSGELTKDGWTRVDLPPVNTVVASK